jgi:hypothetical protein
MSERKKLECRQRRTPLNRTERVQSHDMLYKTSQDILYTPALYTPALYTPAPAWSGPPSAGDGPALPRIAGLWSPDAMLEMERCRKRWKSAEWIQVSGGGGISSRRERVASSNLHWTALGDFGVCRWSGKAYRSSARATERRAAEESGTLSAATRTSGMRMMCPKWGTSRLSPGFPNKFAYVNRKLPRSTRSGVTCHPYTRRRRRRDFDLPRYRTATPLRRPTARLLGLRLGTFGRLQGHPRPRMLLTDFSQPLFFVRGGKKLGRRYPPLS